MLQLINNIVDSCIFLNRLEQLRSWVYKNLLTFFLKKMNPHTQSDPSPAFSDSPKRSGSLHHWGQSLRAPVFGKVGIGFQLNFRPTQGFSIFAISDTVWIGFLGGFPTEMLSEIENRKFNWKPIPTSPKTGARKDWPKFTVRNPRKHCKLSLKTFHLLNRSVLRQIFSRPH